MKRVFLLSLTVAAALSGIAQTKNAAAPISEFTHPDILSFEEGTQPMQADKKSKLTLTDQHFKHLQHALQWNWRKAGAQISIRQSVSYCTTNYAENGNLTSTFVWWIYNPTPLADKQLKVEFLKNGRVCSWFYYNLDFSGWRGDWIAFERDMQGKPEIGMDEMRITAPADVKKGTLYFDHIVLSSLQDSRQHTASQQAPFVNPGTQNHWLVLLESWNAKLDIPLLAGVSEKNQVGLDVVKKRLYKQYATAKTKSTYADLVARFERYQIRQNADGSVCGVPVFPDRFGETYENIGTERIAVTYSKLYNNEMGITYTGKYLLDLARAYTHATGTEKEHLAEMYVLLTRHLLDQGFQAGSAMGTLHHLGYCVREFYVAMFLMEEPLKAAGLLPQVQQSVEWFSGTGEIKTAPAILGMDIDAFNTSLTGRLISIMLLPDEPYKVAYLQAFSRWVDNGLQYATGTRGSFKIDGCIYHHRHNYPAYAVGGLDGAVAAVRFLANTNFAVSEGAHQNLKKSLLAMRTYCNILNWPLSLSGRHPDGKGKLQPEHFCDLALAGSPDRSEKIDRELGAAYLRLAAATDKKIQPAFAKAGIEAETAPQGNWAYNYSCLAVQRRNNWMATAMGHSRYLWAAETYRGANHYGRYLTHGCLQLQATGNPITLLSSGFKQDGWDWGHIPGTTAIALPVAQLRSDVKNLDAVSGYEEMLLSDESFAGAITLQNKNGAFGMKLHEHDKYNGSHRARKSYFFFDNRIVALGSDIENTVTDYPTHTTLFQVYQPEKEITPFKKDFTGNCVLDDGLGNRFFVKGGKTEMIKSLQQSLHEETDQPTQNNYLRASIDHGCAPQGGYYEYAVLVQPEAQAAAPAYQVLQCDRNAHIVCDSLTQITAFVLFEANKQLKNNWLRSNSAPCMAMLQPEANGKMHLSVCDPDLHFYEGESDEQFDADGKRVERTVYSRAWIDNESAVSTIEITLQGKWTVPDNDFITVKARENDNTILSISCQHGFSREVELTLIKD